MLASWLRRRRLGRLGSSTDAEASDTRIDGLEGLLAQMTKAVLERALNVEITDHLGYDSGDPATVMAAKPC